MAKSFYYPVNELASATLTDGTFNVVDPFSSSNVLTNEERATDQSIGTAITSWSATNDSLRFDLGSAVAIDFVALYFSSSETDNLTLYSNSSSDFSASLSTSEAMTSTFSKGWTVVTFSSDTKQYWLLRATSGAIANLTEVIIGKKYDFDINFDLSNKIGEDFGTDIVTSYGGNEYSNKRHEPKTTWDWTWSFLTSGQKTSLDNLNSTVQDHKKFIYYDETNYHYVRMTKPMNFTEVAHSIYSTSVSLREQLS
jgi:hypothetical protein